MVFGNYGFSKSEAQRLVRVHWLGLEGEQLGKWIATGTAPNDLLQKAPPWEFPKVKGTLLWGLYNKGPTI